MRQEGEPTLWNLVRIVPDNNGLQHPDRSSIPAGATMDAVRERRRNACGTQTR